MNAGVVICQADKQKELEVVGTTCWSANPSGTYLNKITLLRGDDDDIEEKGLYTFLPQHNEFLESYGGYDDVKLRRGHHTAKWIVALKRMF